VRPASLPPSAARSAGSTFSSTTPASTNCIRRKRWPSPPGSGAGSEPSRSISPPRRTSLSRRAGDAAADRRTHCQHLLPRRLSREANAPAYGAAKAGLNALGQSLAKALAAHRVLVFTLAPGWVDTDMAAEHLRGPRGAAIVRDIPLGRVATAREVARAAAWLALDAPESMTGCVIDVNGASYLRT